MKYAYRIIDGSGKRSNGEVESGQIQQVIRSLLGQGYTILSLKEVKRSKINIDLDFGFRKIRNKDILAVTSQMAVMIGSGLPIMRAIAILHQQNRSPAIGRTLREIEKDLSTGLSLWEALGKHPGVFSKVYVNMVKAGELGGILEKVLQELYTYLEWEQKIRAKVKAASMYPCLVMSFAALVTLFIMVFVIPGFIDMFQASSLDMPLPTRIVMSCSQFLVNNWLLLLASGTLFLLVLKKGASSAKGRWILDKLYLHLPLIGKTMTGMITARFARTMGTLIASGVPILSAFEVVKGVTGNVIFGEAIALAGQSISRGGLIAAPLEVSGVFDPMVTRMISVGELTGTLDDMLISLADFYDQEVFYMVEALMAVLEPLLIIGTAILVGVIVAATILPIFQLSTTMT